jgi:hypothetical protein
LHNLSSWLILSSWLYLLLSLYWLVFKYIWLKLLYSLFSRNVFNHFRGDITHNMFDNMLIIYL